MSPEKLNTPKVRNIYKSEQKGVNHLPISAEILVHNWIQTTIPVKELIKKDFQIYAGFNLDLNNPTEGESGHFMRALWLSNNHQSQISWMADSFLRLDETIKMQRKLDSNDTFFQEYIYKGVKNIDQDLARISIDHPEKPLILLNGTHGILPVPTGTTIDGTRRTLALALALYKGDIQEDAPVNVIVGDINPAMCYTYNNIVTSQILTHDEFAKELLEERNNSQEYDLLPNID